MLRSIKKNEQPIIIRLNLFMEYVFYSKTNLYSFIFFIIRLESDNNQKFLNFFLTFMQALWDA
jgi:hypothetical protein